MPKLIVTSRYLKSGSKKKLANYVKYIATREGSVPTEDKNEQAPATKNQQELILSLINDFPDSKELFEYEDYIKNPTVKNSSDLISEIIDRNLDRLTTRENYVGYLANRPGAVKFGSHGLFNEKNEPISLDKVAKEIANHSGNVWTHVVSLRRDDAQAMGYDNLNAWRELVKRQIPNIAKNQKINMSNLKWYAAFHDKKTNPHVHIIVYSTNEREGFLTNQGIEKIRSGFANDIYTDELHHLYAQQTDLRNLLKKESEKLVIKLADDISHDNIDNEKLIDLVSKLHNQLNTAKGKKVYGYLKPEIKKTVDEIFSKLAENESIKKMYSLWCEMEQQKHDVYSSVKVKFPMLTDNKAFKSVKNMIIQTVLDMESPILNFDVAKSEPILCDTDNADVEISPLLDESEQSAEEGTVTINTADFVSDSEYYLKWSKNYKEACKLIYDKNSKLEDFQKAEQLLLTELQSGNVLATHDFGKLYSTDKLGEIDLEMSRKYYFEALKGFLEIEPTASKLKSYVQYRIGKMYCYGLGTEKNYTKAFEWFLKSAKENNKFAQFSLANLYYYGNGVEKDLSQAFLWYQKSASQGQPYASYAVAQMYSKGEYVSKDDNTAQQFYKQALSGFLNLERKEQADDNLCYKIGMMYKNCLGTDFDVSKAIEYFQRSAENKWSSYQLGKLYLFGADGLEKDKEKAIRWLTKSADAENEYAQKLLDNMEQYENAMLANTVFGLFVNLSRCIEEDYAQKYQSVRRTVDRKLRRMILKKKHDLGERNNNFVDYQI